MSFVYRWVKRLLGEFVSLWFLSSHWVKAEKYPDDYYWLSVKQS